MTGPRPGRVPEPRVIEGSPAEPAFATVVADLLRRGVAVRFRATGTSMAPTILDGDTITVEPVPAGRLRRGDVVLALRGGAVVAHRLIRWQRRAGDEPEVVLRGDAAEACDPPTAAGDLFGRVLHVERRGRSIAVASWRTRIAVCVNRVVRRLRARPAR